MSDTDELFPTSYYSWRYCISEKCKIALVRQLGMWLALLAAVTILIYYLLR